MTDFIMKWVTLVGVATILATVALPLTVRTSVDEAEMAESTKKREAAAKKLRMEYRRKVALHRTHLAGARITGTVDMKYLSSIIGEGYCIEARSYVHAAMKAGGRGLILPAAMALDCAVLNWDRKL